MIKKIIILSFFILFCAGMFWKKQTKTFVHQDILQNDQKLLEKNINPQTLKNKKWTDINNYSIKAKDLVTKKNARYFFMLTHLTISDLVICLKKDFCGMERRSEDDSYFDENKTPGHILLTRNLAILLSSLQNNPDLKNEVDWDMMRELTASGNENIQVLAIEILQDFQTVDNDQIKLLKIVDEFRGNAKALALVELAKQDSSVERSSLINSIENSFARNDPNTVISIVEKLKKMNLSQMQLEKVSKNLCHYFEKGANNPNWKMIKYDMRKMKIDLDIICSN